MRRVLVLTTLLMVAGCQTAPAKSVEYYAAHEAEANEVIADCTAGKTTGAACDNAREGLRTIADAKAMKHVEQPTHGGAGLGYKRQ